MPVGILLVGVPGPEQPLLAEVGSDDLEAERQAVLVEAARQAHRGRPGHVVGGSERDQPLDRAFLGAQRLHEGVAGRRIGLRGDDDGVDIGEDRVERAGELVALDLDAGVLHAAQRKPRLDQARQHRPVVRLARGVVGLVGDGRVGAAEVVPALDHHPRVGEGDGADVGAAPAQHVDGVHDHGGHARVHALRAVGLVQADAHVLDPGVEGAEVVRHRRPDGGGVGGIEAGDDAEDGGAVGRRARHRPDVVEGLGEGEGAGPADQSPARLEPGHAAGLRGEADRAARVGPQRAVAEARRGGDAGAARRDAGPVVGMPGVDRRRDRGVVHRIGALGHLQLAGEDGAGLAQPRRHGAVHARAPVAQRDRAHVGGRVPGQAEVLEAEGDAVERPAHPPCRDLLVRLRRLFGRHVGHHGGVAAERAVQPLDPRQRVRRHLGGGHLARGDLGRDLGQHQRVQVRHANLRPRWWPPIERQSPTPRKAILPALRHACRRPVLPCRHSTGMMAPR